MQIELFIEVRDIRKDKQGKLTAIQTIVRNTYQIEVMNDGKITESD